ncbi:MAG: hypothetical protein Q4F57_08005, partial [Weeksellaceae bacterium]|nr:hypothetical protein [Weeksellaceae bacterium]
RSLRVFCAKTRQEKQAKIALPKKRLGVLSKNCIQKIAFSEVKWPELLAAAGGRRLPRKVFWLLQNVSAKGL